MYLTRFTIKNIKCFGRAEFQFADPQNGVKRWNVILGENGAGKSTLLQAIGLALIGPDPANRLGRFEGWVRGNLSSGSFTAEVASGELDSLVGSGRPRGNYTVTYSVTGAMTTEIGGVLYDRPTLIFDGNKNQLNSLKRGLLSETATGWFAAGYGPFRRLRGGSVDATRLMYPGQKEARFVTLFREDAALEDLDEWLRNLDHRSRQLSGAGSQALNLKGAIQKVIDRLLPQGVKLVDIGPDGAFFSTPYRDLMPMSDLSDGYRSMLALAIDLLRRLSEAYEQTSDWIDNEGRITAEGVVLIDELDAHLHPVWQREIGFWLPAQFPRLQFIVATHSPFVPQAADDHAVWVLRTNPDDPTQVNAGQDVPSVKGWRADQILTVLFNVSDLRDPETEQKIRRHAELQAQRASGQLTLLGSHELDELTLWLDENLPPPGDSIAEKAHYANVRQQVEAFLREQGGDDYRAAR